MSMENIIDQWRHHTSDRCDRQRW